MHYCPYCSAPISENAKTCHNCKKSLDLNIIADVIKPGQESNLNKSVLRKIWLKEHARYFWPVITLIIGFVIGGILLYSYALIEFSSEKENLNSQISTLQAEIDKINSSAQNAQSGLQSQLDAKDQIIALLTQQRQTISRIINFTRRLANNSIITPNSVADATSFKNNYLYLRRQFDNQQEQLNSTDYQDNTNFNLETMPQFLLE